MKKNKEIVLFGYSGHAFVAAEVILKAGYTLMGYLDKQEQELNPYGLKYLGFEEDVALMNSLYNYDFFPSIGNNNIRRKVFETFIVQGFEFITAIHPKANIASMVMIGQGSLVCQGANINPLVAIGKGVIINTGAIIEHECIIDNFAHIAPGAVLAGKVKVGKGSFIGANAVIKQGVVIGDYVTIGAGTVVLRNIASNSMVVGNPAKPIKK